MIAVGRGGDGAALPCLLQQLGEALDLCLVRSVALLARSLELSGLTAADAMTPRRDIVAVATKHNIEDNRELMDKVLAEVSLRAGVYSLKRSPQEPLDLTDLLAPATAALRKAQASPERLSVQTSRMN